MFLRWSIGSHHHQSLVCLLDLHQYRRANRSIDRLIDRAKPKRQRKRNGNDAHPNCALLMLRMVLLLAVDNACFTMLTVLIATSVFCVLLPLYEYSPMMHFYVSILCLISVFLSFSSIHLFSWVKNSFFRPSRCQTYSIDFPYRNILSLLLVLGHVSLDDSLAHS